MSAIVGVEAAHQASWRVPVLRCSWQTMATARKICSPLKVCQTVLTSGRYGTHFALTGIRLRAL
jgi:hypothetical protein